MEEFILALLNKGANIAALLFVIVAITFLLWKRIIPYFRNRGAAHAYFPGISIILVSYLCIVTVSFWAHQPRERGDTRHLDGYEGAEGQIYREEASSDRR